MGDKKANLRRALAEVEERGLALVKRRSSFYRTEPVGIKDQDDFINAAVMIETDMDLADLMEGLLEVEKSMGRVREPEGSLVKDGPRIIDLDILISGDEVVKQEGLQVPHPRLAERGFVLEPLAEIAPDEKHPETGMTVSEMLMRLDDPAKVERLKEKL